MSERLETESGGTGFVQMQNTLRDLLAALAGANPPEDLIAEATHRFDSLTHRFHEHQVDECVQLTGRLPDAPGRAQTLIPPVQKQRSDRTSMSGTVTFSRHYLGGNGAVHGGAIPLVFDDVLGHLAETDRPRHRTAYLHVDYRRITPIDRQLQIYGWFEKEEGRKRHVRGELRDGEKVCAEANALFVELLPGQP